MKLEQYFISTINTAITNCLLYSAGHGSLDESADRACSIIRKLSGENLEIMIIRNDLVINRVSMRKSGLHGGKFISRLKKRGIARVDFLSGVTQTEIKNFIVNVADYRAEMKIYPHIRAGVTGVRLGETYVDIDDQPDYHADQIDKVRDVYDDISHFKRLETGGLEDVVVNFIITFREESNLLKLLSPVKSFSEYTYTHATNVSVLSMFQAELLGIKGELLHDIGIAALLHDVGKLYIPGEILNKKGPLDSREFSEMTHHTILGAQYLIGVEGLTGLAPIAALEHHCKYDGTGYPAITARGDGQHLCSQIVAIADFFDALRSWRPYRKSLEVGEIITIMKKNSGKDFTPFLLDNFINLLLNAIT